MERKYGYIESPKDLRDYRINKVYKTIELPSEFIVSIGEIKDQGIVNSCVAHAISSILETKDNKVYSTGWIYGYRPSSYYQGEGMITSEALKTVYRVGSLYNDELDVNIEMQEAKDIVDKNINAYKEKASSKKIVSYARLNTANEIKQSLYTSNKPVLLAIKVGVDGLLLDDNNVAYIPEEYSGGHQLVCFGWNGEGFLLQNSWGEDWGNKGTFILPYEYPISEAWMIKFQGDAPDTSLTIKPKFYIIRSIIMKIVKLFRKIFK